MAGQEARGGKAGQAETPVTLISLFGTGTSIHIALSQMEDLEDLGEMEVMVAKVGVGEEGATVETESHVSAM